MRAAAPRPSYRRMSSRTPAWWRWVGWSAAEWQAGGFLSCSGRHGFMRQAVPGSLPPPTTNHRAQLAAAD